MNKSQDNLFSFSKLFVTLQKCTYYYDEMKLFKNFKNIRITLCLLAFLFISCEDDFEHNNYYLIGDSIAQCWDIRDDMPSLGEVENWGVGGYKLEDMKNIHNAQLKGKNVIVILGANDVGKINEQSIGEYTSNYIAYLKSLEAKRIYLFSILPHAPENTVAENQTIEKLNFSIRETVQNTFDNVIYLDVYPLFVMPDGRTNMGLFSDGIHPNKNGYERMSDLLKRNLK